MSGPVLILRPLQSTTDEQFDKPRAMQALYVSDIRGRRGRDRMVFGFTTTYMQSVPITTDVVSSNLDQGEVYNIM
jgi:hypothetical protein